MKLSFPLLFATLIAMWLALSGTVALADVIVGALAAYVAVRGLALLQRPADHARRPVIAVKLAGNVLLDVVRSNIDVAALVLRGAARRGTAKFVDIPLDVRHPGALAVLACIITSTPGTAWAGYDRRSNVLTIHVLDLRDEAALVHEVKQRYERPLREIFE